MSILTIVAGMATGLLLGILGSGGSIITMPALMYLVGVAPKSAIAMSLGIVAVTASIAAVQHWRKGNVSVPVALVFSLFGAAGTFVGAKVGVVMPTFLQLGLFAVIMYLAAYRMLRPTQNAPVGAESVLSSANGAVVGQGLDVAKLMPIALHGVIVGSLTGMVGVGGGFLIVPALVLLSGLTMKQAVGTSLAVVSVQSMTGFAGYAGAVAMDYTLMGAFAAVAIAGGIVGGVISHRVPPAKLKKTFAVFLLVVASYIVFREILAV
ncbi:sulfite exporter TauE/SafE family protein [Varunaivibrio sulfuroxidans]|uniref:Probable membrane transporter protein n=1 Tax=Varunaivibrio sulfuroxidans TaxID=1773489 RepID=A0A4R3J727_9PROT|nr:sulfite exporter TauE/SafE family protein [Varunaivibrio sulfuroxidans]TCS60683.1 hypothetical protein EDD55_110160 [Varunaivibrio sulfuroxidans]WES30172.1 sulfite exporter TauE/SafE family protein [Varunaivibrio sulfuroxidans]